MNHRWRSIMVKTIILVITLFIAGLIAYVIYTDEYMTNKVKPVGKHPPVSLSGWIVDWELETSLNDSLYIKNSLDSVQLFFGYFDDQQQLIWNSNQDVMVTKVKEQLHNPNESAHKPNLYLTVVNDILSSNGQSIQKDAAVVNFLSSSPEAQYRFTEQLIAVVKQHALDGVEIDFENIANEDWENVLDFYEFLYNRLSSEHIELRIVLEPKMQFEKAELPVGPQYIVMAYNLFGFHSGPGPKADTSFIGKLTARMENIPGDRVAVAVATGGFSWSEDGLVKALNEQEAMELQQSAISSTLIRDKGSHAITFEYINDQGKKHTVWYADSETLNYWIDAIVQRGYSNISIWRMGNLSDYSLDMLSKMNK